ncbi:hypothetical protein FQN49_007725 [Arthroderma sp. PD_2]|nr:hypothetical protein FQN49_007725 [Arthroderma sp. PD_2]
MPSFPFRRQGGNGNNHRGPLDYSGIQPGRTMAEVVGRCRFPYINAPGPGFRSAEHLIRQQPHAMQARVPSHSQVLPVQTHHSLFHGAPSQHHRHHQADQRAQARAVAHLAHQQEVQTVPQRRSVFEGHRCHQPPYIVAPTHSRRRHTQGRDHAGLRPGFPIPIHPRHLDARHHADRRPRHHRRRHLIDDEPGMFHDRDGELYVDSDLSSDDESLLGVPSFLREEHDRRRRRRRGWRHGRSRDRAVDDSSADESPYVYDDEYDDPWASDRRWDDSRSFVRKRPDDGYWWVWRH